MVNIPKEHTLGYEIKSKQVRAYETNDLSSVHRALSVNTQEYLAHEGLEEDPPMKLSTVFLETTAIAVGFYLFISKITFHTNPVAVAACFAAFVALVGGMTLNTYMQQSSDLVFQGTGKVRRDPPPKALFASLQGKRLSVFLVVKGFSPEVKFVAQITKAPALFRKPEVISSVEKKVQYGKYFGSTGFFYPPALTQDLDSLLKRLAPSSR